MRSAVIVARATELPKPEVTRDLQKGQNAVDAITRYAMHCAKAARNFHAEKNGL